MKDFEYECVMYNGLVFCNECCPVPLTDEEVRPVFASTESNTPFVCDECGQIHDYMVTEELDDTYIPDAFENLPIQEDDSVC